MLIYNNSSYVIYIGADDPCFEEGVCPVDHTCIRPNLHRNNFECIRKYAKADTLNLCTRSLL